MSTESHPATGTTAGVPAAPLDLPAGTVIHMIAFAWHDAACRFVSIMTRRANRLRDGAACQTIVSSRDRFEWAAQAQVDVMLVSAHGPAHATASPVLGDGDENEVDLASLNVSQPFRFGARAGIAWDACFTGQPQFQAEFARLSVPGAGHIASLGEIKWYQSLHMGETLIDELLAPGGTPVTTSLFAAAAAKTAAAAAAGTSQAKPIKLWHSR